MSKEFFRKKHRDITFSVGLDIICASLHSVKFEGTSGQWNAIVIEGQFVGSRLLGYARHVISAIIVVLYTHWFLLPRGGEKGSIKEPFRDLPRCGLSRAGIYSVNQLFIHKRFLIFLGLALDLVHFNRFSWFLSLDIEGASRNWLSGKQHVDVMASDLLWSEHTVIGAIFIVNHFTGDFLPAGALDGTLGYTYMR